MENLEGEWSTWLGELGVMAASSSYWLKLSGILVAVRNGYTWQFDTNRLARVLSPWISQSEYANVSTQGRQPGCLHRQHYPWRSTSGCYERSLERHSHSQIQKRSECAYIAFTASGKLLLHSHSLAAVTAVAAIKPLVSLQKYIISVS